MEFITIFGSAGRAHMDVIEEVEDMQEENVVPVSSDNSIRKPTKAFRLPHLQVLNRVKFNSTQETPRSTIKGILKKNNDHQLNFKKEELSKIEEKLKLALIVFYNELHLLKSYSSLNLMALSKIMKKYDKISSRDASKTYLKMVDNSYLGTSDEVNMLMERVEGTFIKHFTQSNRRKGLDMLRPKAKKERHRITFSLGFFSGCTASLVLALVLVVRLHRLVEEEGVSQYMENMFPLYSFFGFIVLHMLMYSMDIYFWRRYRINYPFIFGFKQGTELNDREVLLLCTGLATLALGSILSNLDMEVNSKTKDYQAFTELLPLVLVILVLLIMFCPFNIIYRSSRWFLLTCALHCLCAPLYKVTLPDFFLADQITSQVQAIRSVEFYICYYGWGDFKHRRNTCKDSSVYQTFNFIIATIPYWWRFFQCIRRFYEEKDSMQGCNGLKYFSTIIAVSMRTAYSRRKTMKWRVMAWSSSAIAAGVSTYWDLVIDWGLLQRHSRNPWLRDKLLISHKSVYFGAMVINVLLRLAWIQTVLNFKVLPVHREALISIVASLEILRRGIWNFFRLENEHLNNVENYRAIKSVPLPFNYLVKEDDD